jgi:tetratricopeptide (TPR) repeat protein
MAAESVEGLCVKARQAIEQRNPERARQLYLQALGLKADSPEVHYGLATVCFQLKELTSAAHHFKEVTRLDSSKVGAYINLGAVSNLLDHLDDAVAALRKAIQLDPQRGEAYYNLGLVYRRKNQPELALQAYREALRVNPRMGDAHYNLANLYVDKQQYKLALNHYRQALELRPGWEKAAEGLAQVEALMEEADHPAEQHSGAAVAQDGTKPTSQVAEALDLDPERMIDPNAHGVLLNGLHKATIDSENYTRHFLQVIEKEIEPAIKELSSALLYADTSGSELDEAVQKFESAIQNMRSAQRSLENSVEKVRSLGDRLLQS